MATHRGDVADNFDDNCSQFSDYPNLFRVPVLPDQVSNSGDRPCKTPLNLTSDRPNCSYPQKRNHTPHISQVGIWKKYFKGRSSGSFRRQMQGEAEASLSRL
ncbi:MAG: hypothetical protein ACFE0J_24570 [Elainellaceae cyanobacterium]